MATVGVGVVAPLTRSWIVWSASNRSSTRGSALPAVGLRSPAIGRAADWGFGVDRLPVCVFSDDPISKAGVVSQLRPRPEVWIVDDSEAASATVAIAVVADMGDKSVAALRALQRASADIRVVAVVTNLDDGGLLRAVESGASAILRRSEATPQHLAEAAVAAAAGDGTLAPDLLGRLLGQVEQLGRHVLAPRGLGLSGLFERELEVLRLLAEGLDTAEVAQRLSYSERTVKNVIHDVTTRLRLRNRSHAVAYAVRHGLI
jgi:DNA-binding NarL/FixJ family response regulator